MDREALRSIGRLVDLLERGVVAAERIAAALERRAGTASARPRARPRRVSRDVAVDDLSRQRAKQIARSSGFKLTE
jgi:hypothetical protein